MSLPKALVPLTIESVPRDQVPYSKHNYWRQFAEDLLAYLMAHMREGRKLQYEDSEEATKAYDGLRRIIHRHPAEIPLIVRKYDSVLFVVIDEPKVRMKVEAMRKGA